MIASNTNENFRRWVELLTSRGIKKHGQFLLFGEKVVSEVMAIEGPKGKLLELIVPQESEAVKLPIRETKGLRIMTIASALFKEIDVFGTRAPILVARAPEVPAWDPAAEPSGLELLCPIGDPSNLGALLRSALAFGVSRIVLLRECAHPLHPKCMRSLSSNPFALPFASGPSLAEVLSNKPAGLVALDLEGEIISKFKWPKDTRLILGEEGPGFSVPVGSGKD
ncbi:MAG: TrmH family RNA methyltransferase, partial [Bdellovibrionia bacterium]